MSIYTYRCYNNIKRYRQSGRRVTYGVSILSAKHKPAKHHVAMDGLPPAYYDRPPCRDVDVSLRDPPTPNPWAYGRTQYGNSHRTKPIIIYGRRLLPLIKAVEVLINANYGYVSIINHQLKRDYGSIIYVNNIQ